MESRKPGVLQQLRQKMLPRLRRGKTSPGKSLLHQEHLMDGRMSASVPDMRDMRQDYPAACRRPLQRQQEQFTSACYSDPSSPFVKQHRGLGGAEHRLSIPVDSTDWASSQESFNSLCDEQRSLTAAPGMEPAELELPEMMTVYSPEASTVEPSQENSQVRLHC